ncbi:MAG TPA: ubiquinol-cytochrome C chaperone family protein [Sphingomicrobium sp.]|jgi:cytochrome b pre-mRNA-processing protein 3
MLDYLFRRLTADKPRGGEVFEAATQLARGSHWYVESEVPDTLDGRFAVLATIMALILVRLESEGDEGNRLSVGLTERFVEVMESEHRELGLGDPTLGRTVRKLVGSLSRRTDLWRSAVNGEKDWQATTLESLYKTEGSPEPLERSAAAMERLWAGLQRAPLENLEEGDF